MTLVTFNYSDYSFFVVLTVLDAETFVTSVPVQLYIARTKRESTTKLDDYTAVTMDRNRLRGEGVWRKRDFSGNASLESVALALAATPL